MKYLKTYESIKQDFDKEIKDIEQRKIELINNTKETVDEFMFSLTDDYDDSDNNWVGLPWHGPSVGISIKDEPVKTWIKHSNWDGKKDLSSWYHSVGTTGLSKRIEVETLFTITYYLKCKYSDNNDYRLYDKRDKLDTFIDELESTTQRIKEILGLEYRIMARYAYNWKGDIGYHSHNHNDYSDITFLKAELAYQKDVDQYQQEKFGKPNGIGYTNVEILLELL